MLGVRGGIRGAGQPGFRPYLDLIIALVVGVLFLVAVLNRIPKAASDFIPVILVCGINAATIVFVKSRERGGRPGPGAPPG